MRLLALLIALLALVSSPAFSAGWYLNCDTGQNTTRIVARNSMVCAQPTTNADDTDVLNVEACENFDVLIYSDRDGDGTAASTLTHQIQHCPGGDGDLGTDAIQDAACVDLGSTHTGTGATLAFGSDWPVSSGDPRDGLAIAASRRTVHGDPAGGWTPHEIVPMDDALGAYTAAVAHQAFADRAAAPWGRIVPGASADLVWLARDPRTVDPHELPAVEVRETYLAGVPCLVRAAAESLA